MSARIFCLFLMMSAIFFFFNNVGRIFFCFYRRIICLKKNFRNKNMFKHLHVLFLKPVSTLNLNIKENKQILLTTRNTISESIKFRHGHGIYNTVIVPESLKPPIEMLWECTLQILGISGKSRLIRDPA